MWLAGMTRPWVIARFSVEDLFLLFWFILGSLQAE